VATAKLLLLQHLSRGENRRGSVGGARHGISQIGTVGGAAGRVREGTGGCRRGGPGNPPFSEGVWKQNSLGVLNEEFRMKKSRFTDPQIMSVLKQAEGGMAVPELCREHGISSATFYKWRSKFGGMDASMMAEMKTMQDENRRLKKMFAELSMQNELLKEALGKK